MIRCNANLFRLASMAMSTEATRYYLAGVHIQPHAVKGVTLVSTDGYRLVCIHDESGHADESAIVHLTPDALKMCKRQKAGVRTLDIQMETLAKGSASVYDTYPTPEETAASVPAERREIVGISPGNCIVDGTFPDWRCVLPAIDFAKPAFATYSGAYLGDFGKLGTDLAAHFNGSHQPCPMTVYSSDKGAPALIRWAGIKSAFGMLMPVPAGGDERLPAFLNATPAKAEAA